MPRSSRPGDYGRDYRERPSSSRPRADRNAGAGGYGHSGRMDDAAAEAARRRLEARRARQAQQSHQARGTAQPHRTRQSQQARPPQQARGTGRSRQAVQPQRPRSLRIKPLLFLLIAVALLVFLTLGVRSCISNHQNDSASDTIVAPEPSQTVDETVLRSLSELDSDYADKLVADAATDPDIAWIVNHAADYGDLGETVQAKILRLAAKDPLAVSYVRNYPEKYPQSKGKPYDEPVSAGTVPNLYQWDERWGYTEYSSAPFALTGCCPTCLSMVAMGLTGDASLTPAVVARMSKDGGYMTEYSGTANAFLLDSCSDLGIRGDDLPISADSVVSALNAGKVIICNVGPGDFTTGGHFIVFAGLTEDGLLKVNDPYSSVNSSKEWKISDVLGQTMALWSYSAA